MDKTTILVCCHKPDEYIRTGKPYLPIQGGKAVNPDIDLGFIGDDTGDNISEKNPEWCELTSLYWAWKNLPRTKYFGIAHYRRYLDIDTRDDSIDIEMGDCDMIVTGPSISPYSNAHYLMYLSTIEDFWIFADTFLEMHPEYGNEFIDYFFNQRWIYPNNVFLCRREVFDEYCEFMMPVLLETDKRMLPGSYMRHRRAISYYGEFMLTLFIICRQKKVKVVDCDKTPSFMSGMGTKRFRSVLHRKFYYTFQNLLCNLYFRHFSAVGKSFIDPGEDVRLWLRKNGITFHVLDKPYYYKKK